ncbi:uncharacterized protein LOC144048469 [Vanacampus margaritifer]
MDYLRLTSGVECHESVQSHLGAQQSYLPGCYQLKTRCCGKTSGLKRLLWISQPDSSGSATVEENLWKPLFSLQIPNLHSRTQHGKGGGHFATCCQSEDDISVAPGSENSTKMAATVSPVMLLLPTEVVFEPMTFELRLWSEQRRASERARALLFRSLRGNCTDEYMMGFAPSKHFMNI